MINAVIALIKGLLVTLKQMFSPDVTVQYPEQRPFTAERWRGVHGLFFTDDMKEELCICCHLCASVCPAVCIEMEGHQEPDGTKKLHTFNVDLGRCIYCGYCEEVCPVDAIRLTTSTDYAVTDREQFVLRKDDLLSVGRSAMKRGEKGALGNRTASGQDVSHIQNRNRLADVNVRNGRPEEVQP